MTDYRFRARSATPGDWNFKAGRLAFLPLASNVWNGIALGDGTTGTKRASSIANCVATNIKSGVSIDDVAGSYGGGGVSDLPDIGNVLDTDTLDGAPGTYHPPTIGEVALGVPFGPASALRGTFNPTAPAPSGNMFTDDLPLFFGEFSETATYIPKTGDPKIILFIAESEDLAGQTPAPPGDEMLIVIKYADVSAPAFGDTVVIDTVTWYLAGIEGGGRAERIWHLRLSRSLRRNIGTSRRRITS